MCGGRCLRAHGGCVAAAVRMLNKLNDRERERLAAVKKLACSMCDTLT